MTKKLRADMETMEADALDVFVACDEAERLEAAARECLELVRRPGFDHEDRKRIASILVAALGDRDVKPEKWVDGSPHLGPEKV